MMNCIHCGKERPYRWVGGQHCHVPKKQSGNSPPQFWPFPDWSNVTNVRDHVYTDEMTDEHVD